MKKKYEFETKDNSITFRIKTSDKEKLEQIAYKNQTTVSAYISNIISSIIKEDGNNDSFRKKTK